MTVDASVSDGIEESLAFAVEAVPRDVLELSNSSKSTPLNLKIKVRKKNEATIKQGILSVPKPGQPGSPPERIRLISSDQTILSFNVFMETDVEKKPLRKPRRHLFGGCLGNEYNQDDDPPYLPTPQNVNLIDKTSKSEERLKQNFTLSKNKDGYDDISSKRQRVFFGKCKPGGCLDPPFSEDNYAYKPTQKTASSLQSSIDPKNMKLKLDEKHTSFTDGALKKQKNNKDNLSSDKLSLTNDKDEITSSSSILSLYQTEGLKDTVSSQYSDSIITYPAAVSSKETFAEKNISIRNKRSSENKSKKSFNEFSDAYFIPPKNIASSRKGSAIENILATDGLSKSDDHKETSSRDAKLDDLNEITHVPKIKLKGADLNALKLKKTDPSRMSEDSIKPNKSLLDGSDDHKETSSRDGKLDDLNEITYIPKIKLKGADLNALKLKNSEPNTMSEDSIKPNKSLLDGNEEDIDMIIKKLEQKQRLKHGVANIDIPQYESKKAYNDSEITQKDSLQTQNRNIKEVMSLTKIALAHPKMYPSTDPNAMDRLSIKSINKPQLMNQDATTQLSGGNVRLDSLTASLENINLKHKFTTDHMLMKSGDKFKRENIDEITPNDTDKLKLIDRNHSHPAELERDSSLIKNELMLKENYSKPTDKFSITNPDRFASKNGSTAELIKNVEDIIEPILTQQSQPYEIAKHLNTIETVPNAELFSYNAFNKAKVHLELEDDENNTLNKMKLESDKIYIDSPDKKETSSVTTNIVQSENSSISPGKYIGSVKAEDEMEFQDNIFKGDEHTKVSVHNSKKPITEYSREQGIVDNDIFNQQYNTLENSHKSLTGRPSWDQGNLTDEIPISENKKIEIGNKLTTDSFLSNINVVSSTKDLLTDTHIEEGNLRNILQTHPTDKVIEDIHRTDSIHSRKNSIYNSDMPLNKEQTDTISVDSKEVKLMTSKDYTQHEYEANFNIYKKSMDMDTIGTLNQLEKANFHQEKGLNDMESYVDQHKLMFIEGNIKDEPIADIDNLNKDRDERQADFDNYDINHGDISANEAHEKDDNVEPVNNFSLSVERSMSSNIVNIGTGSQNDLPAEIIPYANMNKTALAHIGGKNVDYETVSLDFAFHTYINEKNHRVVSTRDPLKDDNKTRASIILIKTQINANSSDIRIPIDSKKYISFSLRTEDALALENESTTIPYKRTEKYNNEQVNQQKSESEIVQNTLTLIYDQQLLPLQSAIKDLRSQVELLGSQQLWLKDNLYKTRKTKSVRYSYSSVNRRCGCMRK